MKESMASFERKFTRLIPKQPTHLCALLCLALSSVTAVAEATVTTASNGIRNARVASVNGESIRYVSEIDGAVASYSADGSERWRSATSEKAVLFDIETADVTGDGNDDLLAASGDGHIYLWDSQGELKWKFSPENKVRFNEVAAVCNEGRVQIFAGGNDCILYELDSKGKQISTTNLGGVIRTLTAGNLLEKDKQSLLVITYSGDKWNWNFLGVMDPETKETVRTINQNGPVLKSLKIRMLTDVNLSDIDKDGLDDILLFGSDKVEEPLSAWFLAINSQMEKIAAYDFPPNDRQLYAHCYGTSLLPARDEIAMVFGTVLYVTDLKGNPIARVGAPYKGLAYNGMMLDSAGKILIGNGQIGGGNTLYSYDLTQKEWWNQEQKLTGRMAEVERNIQELYEQALNFKMPTYQKKAEQSWIMIGPTPNSEVARLTGADLVNLSMVTMTENTDRSHLVATIGKDALKRDKRKKYNQSRAELIEKAKKYESQKKPFVVWAGHGTDPFYIHVETIEEILKVAKTMCYGFVYAEMENSEDPRFHYFVDHYIPRIATALRQQGTGKLFFRYKGIFWAANAHTDPWNKLFFSHEYRDLIVPSTEDTNSRTQELNLAGRVGMLAGGYIDNFAMRLVEDNVTSWRPLSACGQTSISPFLRSGVIRAAYGARYGIMSGLKFAQEPGLNVLYALMTSGVLPQVEQEDILSLGAWHLLQDIDTEHVEYMSEGHSLMTYQTDDDEGVYSVANIAWSGASVPAHDFSKALGVDYRWLNFVPELPYGMIPIGPASLAPTLTEKGIPFTISDTHFGQVDGRKVSADEFGNALESSVLAGAKRLPIVVEGAAWSAVRLDNYHVRLILLDQGYIDPQERNAVIRFHGAIPSSAKDILSEERFTCSEESLRLTVPAGSVRFVDLTYRNKLNAGDFQRP